MSSLSDPELLGRYLAAREEAAFTALVARHGGMVRAVALRVAPRDAEDVTQAVFLLLSQRAESLASRRSLAGWLHETARWVASNARRARSREEARVAAAREAAMSKSSGRSGSSQASAEPDAGFDADLDAVLARLSAADREVVLLRYVEELSLEEAAERLHVSPAAIAKRAERAMARLRSQLRPEVASSLALLASPLPPAEATRITASVLQGPPAAIVQLAGSGAPAAGGAISTAVGIGAGITLVAAVAVVCWLALGNHPAQIATSTPAGPPAATPATPAATVPSGPVPAVQPGPALRPLPPAGRNDTETRRSAANMRQLGQAFLLHSIKLRGRYPETLGDVLLTQDVSAEAFLSPRYRNRQRAPVPARGADGAAGWANLHSDYVYL